EVQTWEHLQHLTVERIVGSEEECFDALRRPADVHTIGRDRVQWLHAQFVQGGKLQVEWPWDTVVLDESQSFASQSSKRWGALSDLRLRRASRAWWSSPGRRPQTATGSSGARCGCST